MGEKAWGIKWHLLVDTLRLVLEALDHSTLLQDRDGVRLVPAKL